MNGRLAELYWCQGEIAAKVARCRALVAELPELPELDVRTPTEQALDHEERRCGIDRREPV